MVSFCFSSKSFNVAEQVIIVRAVSVQPQINARSKA